MSLPTDLVDRWSIRRTDLNEDEWTPHLTKLCLWREHQNTKGVGKSCDRDLKIWLNQHARIFALRRCGNASARVFWDELT